jgi:hypothetical protein
MRYTFRERLSAIEWSNYKTAYGNAADQHLLATSDGKETSRWGSVAEQLYELAANDEAKAIEASHHLWCCLCHQHAYVSSAALPAMPFLLEVLERAGEQLKIEILDILTGFARCSRAVENQTDWIRELRARLLIERPRFEALAKHPNEEIAEWAEGILAELEPSANDPADAVS